MQTKYFDTDLIIERSLETMELTQPTEERNLPLVIEAQDNPSIDFLFSFVKKEKQQIFKALIKHGGILLRGFRVENAQDFENIMHILGINLSNSYKGGVVIRNRITPYIFTSSELPNQMFLPAHTEMCYMENRPRFIAFYCAVEPEIFGETPIYNCREIYQNLNSEAKKLFMNEVPFLRKIKRAGSYKTLRDVFYTDDIGQIENFLKANNIRHYWKRKILYLLHTVPMTIKCPETNEICVQTLTCDHWYFLYRHMKKIRDRQTMFNHSMYGVRILANILRHTVTNFKKLIKNKIDCETPYSVFNKAMADHLFQVREKHSVVFKWKRGDVLMLDNILTGHGRMNVKPPRKILTCFGNMYNRKKLY